MKTLLAVLGLMPLLAGPAAAGESLTQVFAECIGRLSAEREHAWLTGDPDVDRLEAQRAAFLALLDATLPADLARPTLSYRIEVKMAHASLLTLATFGRDPARAQRAERLAARHVSFCQRLLLHG